MGKGVTEIDIKLKDPARIQEFRDKLAKEIAGVEVATWKDLAYGINWGFVMRDVGDIGYRVTGVSRGVWNPTMIVTAFIAGIVISAITSIYPARVASRMEPTEALKRV